MARTWKTLLIYHLMNQAMRRCATRYLYGRLVDIGCGLTPYRALVQPAITDYVGVDRMPRAADVIGCAEQLPLASASCESAISTAALEHVAEPEAALRECYRVLKPGGVAVYTVPLFWPLHAEPWDFYRFTKYGLRHLVEKVGFTVVELNALSGFWVTGATMACYYLARFHRGPLKYLPVIPAVGVLLQCLAYLCERCDKAEQWTWMYEVVMRKE